MTSKDVRDTKTLTQRALAVVFKDKKHRKSEGKNSELGKEKHGDKLSSVLSGKDLFDQFIEANKDCFWNPHLEESIRNLRLVGYLQPYTLLLGGREIYLDTVKSAWSRKSLRPPYPGSCGSGRLVIHRVGDIAPLEMTVAPQSHFTPLPEALCLIIQELCRLGETASLEPILGRLSDLYKGMQTPTEAVVYEALDSLLKERKIYHTGCGYGIVTPDMFKNPSGPGAHHQGGNSHSVTVHDHHLVISPTGHHPHQGGLQHGNIYIPLPPTNTTSPAEVRSISCQTTEVKEDGVDEKVGKNKKLERSLSMRESKSNKSNKEKSGKGGGAGGDSNFIRSSSMRLGDEKSKHLVKDINLKTSQAHQDKDKGEKQSLLSKLFGRGSHNSHHKNKRTVSTSDDSTTPPSGSSGKEEKEFATFSAQFPPPDWQLYEHQVQQALAISQGHMSRSATWHHGYKPGKFLQDAAMQSDLDLEDEPSYDCPIHKSSTLPAYHVGGGLLDDSFLGQPARRQRSTSDSSRSSSYQEIPAATSSPTKTRGDLPGVVPPMMRPRRVRRKSSHHRRSYSHGHKTIPENLDSSGDFDVRPKLFPAKNRVVNGDLVGVGGEGDVGGNRYSLGDTLEESVEHYQDLNDLSAAADREPLEGEPGPVEVQNPFTTNSRHRHKSHQKAKIFRKYREMHCTSFCDNDISVEYHGKLPKKGGSISASKDSGVNCVGLGNGIPTATSTPSDAVRNQKFCVPSSQRNSSPLQLNNQPTGQHSNQKQPPFTNNNMRIVETTFNNDSANTVTVHHAQIHCMPESSPSQEDSGFNSPRTVDFVESFNNANTPQQTSSQSSSKPFSYHCNMPKTIPVPDLKNNQDKALSIENLHAQNQENESDIPLADADSNDLDLTASGSWSNSSRQTVKEAIGDQQLPLLPPLRPWPHPSERDANSSLSYSEDFEAPREGSPNRVDGIVEAINVSPPRAASFKETNIRVVVSSNKGARENHNISFESNSSDPKVQHNKNVGHLKELKSENRHSRHFISASITKKTVSKEDKDKVKRNLGDALENLPRDGSSRLHQRAFREYHSAKATVNANGDAKVVKDYEVVGIV